MTYFERLKSEGRIQDGSAIGQGECLRKTGEAGPLHEMLGGYIRVLARDMEDAKTLVHGNPTYEAGGTVEVRELPR